MEGDAGSKRVVDKSKLIWKMEWDVLSRWWRGDEGINGVPVGMVKVVGWVQGEGSGKSSGGGGNGRGGAKGKEDKKVKGPKPMKKALRRELHMECGRNGERKVGRWLTLLKA